MEPSTVTARTPANGRPLVDGSARRRLRRLNRVVGLLHAGQAALLLAIAADATLPVSSTYMTGPPGSGEFDGGTLFDLPVAPLVAAFLALAAVDHLLTSGGRVERWYQHNLARGTNPARWWEYSVSASLMVVLIAMLTGISEVTALVALFGVNAAMILFGLAMERANPPGAERIDWRPFVYGCVAGAVPWIAIGFQLVRSETATGGDVPGFVFAIFASLFVLFNTFAVNMWLHYRARARGRGRWRDPLFTERVYVWLSLGAKTALAWQVYAGALAGG